MPGMTRTAALGALLLLGACAQGPTLQQRLSVFMGQGEGDLVAALGVPVRVHEAEGRRFLQFEQRRTVAVAAPQPFPYYGRFGPRFSQWPQPPGYAVIGCDITFELQEGRVQGFSTRGEGCR